MLLESNIIVYLLAANFICCFGIAIYSFLKTHNKHQIYFTLMMLMIAEWSLTAGLEAASTSIGMKIIFSKLEYIGALSAGVLFFKFSAGFTMVNERWKKYYGLLWVVPFLIVSAAFTNEYHHLLWKDFSWSIDGKNILTYHHGPLFLVASMYSVVIILLTQAILINALKTLPELAGKQTIVFIVASCFPLIAVILYATGFTFIDGLDIIVLSFSLTGMLLLYGIVRFNILDIVPIIKERISSIIPDGLLILDHHCHLVFSNNVAVNLLEPQYGKLKYDISSIDWLSVALDDFIQDGVRKKEVIAQDKNGEWYSVMFSLLTDKSKRLRGITIILRNISQRKKLEIERQALNLKISESNLALLELNTQKDKILSIIGHDLKTSFHQIIALSLIIKENSEMFSKTDVFELVDDIDTAAQNGNKVLQDLLEWAHTQQQAATVKPSEFNIYEVVQEVLQFLNKLISGKQLKIENRLQADTMAFADRNMITVVIRNLLANAIKFSFPKHTIFLDCEKMENGQLNLSITDQGKGINPEDLSKLFNSNIKFTTLGTDGEQGNGMGLSLTYEMMIKNNGSIKVESEPGKGTSFILSLPAIKPQSDGRIELTNDTLSYN